MLIGLVLAAIGHLILYQDPTYADAPFEVNPLVTIIGAVIGLIGALAREAMDPVRWSSDI